MIEKFKKFLSDETGAVIVDWVVLTAAIVGLTLSVMAAVSNGLEDMSGDIESELSAQDISSTF